MTMKNRFLVSLILGALPLTMLAQDDDMYFVPSKKKVERESATYVVPRSTYYSGSNRSVDEYNRRGTGSSYYQVLPTDSAGNDIINFSGELGVYPDSTSEQDFALTRQMARYDGYEPSIAYQEGYRDGTRDSWHSPWYYSSFYSSYYPWYDSYWYWNDPWYYRHYGWYSTWYDPWYYDRYYWYGPRWYGGYYGGYTHRPAVRSVYARNGNTGTIDRRGNSHGRFTGGGRLTTTTTSRATPTYNRSNSGNFSRSTTNSNSGNFSRSTTNSSRSTTNFGSSSSSGSFSRSSGGGSFSSGGGGGASRSGGGGIGRAGRR